MENNENEILGLVADGMTKGEDMTARTVLCSELETVIGQSEAGKMSLAEFADSLDRITSKAREFLKLPWDSEKRDCVCNKCGRSLYEEELDVSEEMRSCPACGTDEYLMDS